MATGVKYRIERDFLGEKQLPAEALYGIHSVRATENFPDKHHFSFEWYRAMGLVKLACLKTIQAYGRALDKRTSGPADKRTGGQADREKIEALIMAAEEISRGEHFYSFIVPAIQGGAGTSINMNINEILSNVALLRLKRDPGDYTLVDPLEDANRYQSTNDVVPTALKVATIFLLQDLEKRINALREEVEKLEQAYRNTLRIGYTQMQEAVPTSFGKLFGSYCEALSRDWWRVSKCFERLKEVNLGGGAVGTAIALPQFYTMQVVRELQQLTGLPVTRGEHLPDTTANMDPLVEVHAILKAHAVNLEKIVSDIRLLSSDIANPGSRKSVTIPAKQTGSTIMPGKVNPVISEFVIGAAHQVYANDQLIAGLAGQGCLELNAYLPVMGNALLESINLLISCDQTLREHLFTGLAADHSRSLNLVMHSPSLTTALIPYIGYNKASEIAAIMRSKGIDIIAAWGEWTGGQADRRTSGQADRRPGGQSDRRTGGQADKRTGGLDEKKLREILKPENLLKLGYTLKDLEG